MIVLKTSDFIGNWQLAKNNYDTQNIQQAIDVRERYMLDQLLGETLAGLFIADLSNGVPITAKYVTIFNLGIKYVLLSDVYHWYVTNKTVADSQSGITQPLGDAATVQNHTNQFRNAEKKWNDILCYYDNIQTYILANFADYPDFAGVEASPYYASIL